MWSRGLIALLLLTFASSVFGQLPRIRGASFQGTETLDLVDESLLNLRQVGANSIALEVVWHQANRTDSSFLDLPTQTYQDLVPLIEAAHGRDFDVLLHPRVEVNSGTPSALLDPASRSDWFEAYEARLLELAEFANENSVAMFSIGSNLNRLESESSTWSTLVQRVRDRFDGDVTYAAGHQAHPTAGGGFHELEWWNELDLIGIDAFFSLTFDINAELDALRDGAIVVADEIETFRDRADLSQPVLFTDFGFRSIDGGAVFPLGDGRGGDPIDVDEQAWAFDAVLGEVTQRSWWGGGFVRGWSADPHGGGEADGGFTPQQKPAEAILANYYGGRANFALKPERIESWENGFQGWSLPDSPPSATGAMRIDTNAVGSHGQNSLAIPSSDSGELIAARVWPFNTENQAYALFDKATEQQDSFDVQFDVTVNTAQSAGERTRLLVSLEDDRDSPVVLTADLQFAGEGLQTETVTLPLAGFGELFPNSLWYELQLGLDNAWSGVVFIDNLRLRSNLPGDITNDASLDAADIDALSDALRHGSIEPRYDLNSDGMVDELDRAAWFTSADVLPADFDLNRAVDFGDFIRFAENFGGPGNWLDGDANGDRMVNFLDFLVIADHFGQTNALPQTVPEPNTSHLLLIGIAVVWGRRRRWN